MSYSHSFDWDVSAWVAVRMWIDVEHVGGCPEAKMSPSAPYDLSFSREKAMGNVRKMKDHSGFSFALPVSIDADELLRIADEVRAVRAREEAR